MASVTLDAAAIIGLASNSEVRGFLPAMEGLLKNGKLCAMCARKKQAVIQSVMQQIAALPDHKKERLKQILGATAIEVYPGGAKVVI